MTDIIRHDGLPGTMRDCPIECGVRHQMSSGVYERHKRRAERYPKPVGFRPHPGENHDFDMHCKTCGEPGMLHVVFITPGERVEVKPPLQRMTVGEWEALPYGKPEPDEGYG